MVFGKTRPIQKANNLRMSGQGATMYRLYALLLIAAGCANSPTRSAGFRVRPDSVAPGSLRGPFDGRILDAATGDPIPGAVIYATWTFTDGLGLNEPSGFHEAITNTDANGYYKIPEVKKVPLGKKQLDARGAWTKRRTSTRLTGFQMVAYKKGFVGYRSDRRFIDFGARLDFAQKKHVIRLRPWRSDLSHARHVRYLGGGTVIASLTSKERSLAASELSGRRTGIGRNDRADSSASTSIVAAELLSSSQVISATGFPGNFDIGPLDDAPNTNTYSSQHFKAVGASQEFDLAVRLWTIGQEPARIQYETLLKELPKAKQTNDVADRSFTAEEDSLYGLVFLDSVRGALVFFTCGKSLCKDQTVLRTLALEATNTIRKRTPAVEIKTGGNR